MLDEILPNLNLRAQSIMNYLSLILNAGIYHYHKKQQGGLGRWMAASEECVRVCVRARPFGRVRAGLNLLSVWPRRRIRPRRARRKGVLADGQIPPACALQHPSQQRSTSVAGYQQQGHWRLGSGRKVALHIRGLSKLRRLPS